MSYEIVKNIRIIPNPENKSEYIIVCKSASNNCFPHYYNEWTYGKGAGLTKEQLEKMVLTDFFKGNLQGGQSSYCKFVKRVCMWYDEYPPMFNKYKKLSRMHDKILRRLFGQYHGKDCARKQELNTLCDKIEDMKRKELEDVLYGLYYSDDYKQYKSKKVKPFIIIARKTGDYVYQMNKRTYYRSSQPRIFTSANVYYEALKYPLTFLVEECTAPGKV